MSVQNDADDESNRETTDLSTLYGVVTGGDTLAQVCLTEHRAREYYEYVLCEESIVKPFFDLSEDLTLSTQDLVTVVVDEHVVALYRDLETAYACHQVHYDGDGRIVPFPVARYCDIPGQTGTQKWVFPQ